MSYFPFTVDERGLAHVDEATRIREFFAREGTPISQEDAKRLAFLNFRMRTRHISDWPEWVEPRPPFVSHDPRKAWAGW